jgi:adenine-specific DNA-methyltransferase
MALEARSPTQRADFAGAAYAARVSDSLRKKQGLYLTPGVVATFMAGEIAASASTVRILDPAAGAGILLCAAVETLVTRAAGPKRIELVAYEIDAALVEVLTGVLGHLKDWARSRGTEVAIKVVPSDFILEHAGSLSSIGGFLPHLEARQAFDVVIANPPYFKLNKADRRAKVAAAVVHGQPNIYSLFMAIGAALLREGGELIYITPRSFASGPYFRLFREWFFNNVRPAWVHVFGSRRQAFSRDEVLQENVILKAIRRDTWADRKGSALLTISASHGIEDLDSPDRRSVQLAVVLDMASREKVLRLPVSPDEDDLLRFVDCWPGSLGAYGLQISTGPVVPFRATEFVEDRGRVPERHVPLLWMNHVKRMQVRWPLGQHKPEYMKHVKAALPLLVPNRNYVLLRRFSAKEETRRLVAGPYLARAYSVSMLGLENHLNYIYRPGGSLSDDEAFGLAALFSSSLLDRYFRTSNGNTQVSATELRAMPLPAHEMIVEIGRQAQSLGSDVDAIDALVMRLAGTEHEKMKARARG